MGEKKKQEILELEDKAVIKATVACLELLMLYSQKCSNRSDKEIHL